MLLGAKLSPGLAEWIPEGMEVAGGDIDADDVHLIMEYKRNEEWDGVVSPRANRFIIHHDLNNPLVSSLEQFKMALPAFNPQHDSGGGAEQPGGPEGLVRGGVRQPAGRCHQHPEGEAWHARG